MVFFFFLTFDFCRFCMVIRFFHPRHNGQWPPTSKAFYPRSYPLHFFPILNFDLFYYTTYIMLVGTDVCVRMVFVWEETRVPVEKPACLTWCPHDHLICRRSRSEYPDLQKTAGTNPSNTITVSQFTKGFPLY